MMKKKIVLALLLSFSMMISACSEHKNKSTNDSVSTDTENSAAPENNTSGNSLIIDTSKVFSDRDYEVEYDKNNSVTISLTGDSAGCSSDAVQISGSTVTITEEGCYILSGTLIISSPAGHGIVSKDTLKITSGSYDINCASHGISGKDDICITNADFSIVSGKDGIHAENTEDSLMGYVYIQSGTFEIASGDDAFHADETLTVTDGTITITKSYEGLEGSHIEVSGGDISLTASDDGFNAAGGTDDSGNTGGRDGAFGTDGNGNMDGKDGAFDHGMSSSSNGSITISGGKIKITASGDGIDSNGSLAITGGDIISGKTYTLTVGNSSSEFTAD